MLSQTVSISAHTNAKRLRVAHFTEKNEQKFLPGGLHNVAKQALGAAASAHPLLGMASSLIGGALGIAPSSSGCAMCLYLMETLDRKVGIGEQENTGFGEASSAPSHAVHWPQKLPPTINMPGFASPLGNQPLTHDAIAGPGFALLETASSLRIRNRFRSHSSADQHSNEESSEPVLLQTGSAQGTELLPSAVAAKRAAGFMTCRPSMKYCRPRIFQMGARAAQRRLRMQAEAREQLGMQAAMIDELNKHCYKHLPQAFRQYCSKVSSKIMVVAGEMLHDYSDDEICSDIDMCSSKELGIQGGPGVTS